MQLHINWRSYYKHVIRLFRGAFIFLKEFERRAAILNTISMIQKFSRLLARFLRIVVIAPAFIFGFAILAIVYVYVASTLFMNTPQDAVYRYLDPTSSICRDADNDVKHALSTMFIKSTEKDPFTEKLTPQLSNYLRCSVQKHLILSGKEKKWTKGKPKRNIRYNLGFLELDDYGSPAESIPNSDKKIDFDQLDAILSHLQNNNQKQHYVIVYIHGWRHDARIGDRDVGWLRTIAAYTDSFLDYRCKMTGSTDKRYCDAEVTALYIGWRGARIDERTVLEKFWLGRQLGTLMAGPTLFDRKSVSEQVGYAAVWALERINKVLNDHDKERGAFGFRKNRMITIGHSLGGNALASAIREDMILSVQKHRPGQIMEPAFGDLIVLLNPASEAYNWTSIQREIHKRNVLLGNQKRHNLFSKLQKPIYISVTSANEWPMGGFRNLDLSGKDIKKVLKQNDTKINPEYDIPTHDLFPLFKGDIRPIADSIEKKLIQIACGSENNKEEKLACQIGQLTAPDCVFCMRYFLKKSTNTIKILARFLRNAPFMNSNPEVTHTIGHLDPMRPPVSKKRRAGFPATRIGVTHELVVNKSAGIETKYENASNPHLSECRIVDSWLYRAKSARGLKNQIGWDSGFGSESLVFAKRYSAADSILMQFRHGYNGVPMRSVVLGNDPFWNIRAHDTVVKEHNGVISYPYMCAIQQIVLDNIAAKPNIDKSPP